MEGIWIIEESGVVVCRGLPQRVIKSMLSGKIYECKRHEEMVRNYIFDVQNNSNTMIPRLQILVNQNIKEKIGG